VLEVTRFLSFSIGYLKQPFFLPDLQLQTVSNRYIPSEARRIVTTKTSESLMQITMPDAHQKFELSRRHPSLLPITPLRRQDIQTSTNAVLLNKNASPEFKMKRERETNQTTHPRLPPGVS